MELLPNRVISTVVSPGSRSRAREEARGGTPGTAAAAVRFDIQGWLIYGAGETVPLLWVFMRRRPWQVSPRTYSIIKLRSQESVRHRERLFAMFRPQRRGDIKVAVKVVSVVSPDPAQKAVRHYRPDHRGVCVCVGGGGDSIPSQTETDRVTH